MSTTPTVAALKARRAALRGASSPIPSASGFAAGFPTGNVGFATPGVSTPTDGLVGEVEGLGELSLSEGGDAVTSMFRMEPSMLSILCGGKIKGGLRFCTKGGGSCLAKSHAKKEVLHANALYIAGPTNSAYSHHHLDLEKISDAQANPLLAENKTVTDWARLFHVFSGFEDGLNDAEVSDLKKKLTNVDLPMGMTPKRRKILYSADEEAEDLFSNMTPLAELAPEEDPLARIVGRWDRLVSQVASTTRETSTFRAYAPMRLYVRLWLY